MQECIKFIVKGKVQGVFYRKFVSIAMNKKRVIGFIKNLNDGSVEVLIKAKKGSDISEILNILNEGSPKSEVESILMQECNERVDFSDKFEIRY